MARTYPNGSEFALSLTYDVEMTTGFPYRTCVWDDRTGEIDPAVKAYVLQLNDVAREYKARFHYFVLGGALEDPDVDYLKRVAADGHPVGNHTYRHVRVKARTVEELGEPYKKHPWRAAGRSALECLRDEIRQTNLAIRGRLGVEPSGFRTPGAFATGVKDAPEVQKMLGEEAFAFVSSQYLYPIKIARGPSPEELDAASRSSLDQLQPYRYPSGLPEIPMMAVSDVWAFRHLDLDRKEYLRTLLAAVDYAYERHSVVSLLFHPIVLATHDPSCEVAEALLRRALEKPGGCWVTDNDTLCREVFK